MYKAMDTQSRHVAVAKLQLASSKAASGFPTAAHADTWTSSQTAAHTRNTKALNHVVQRELRLSWTAPLPAARESEAAPHPTSFVTEHGLTWY